MERIRESDWFSEYRKCIEKAEIKEAKRVLLDNIPKDAIIYKYQKSTNRNWNCITNK